MQSIHDSTVPAHFTFHAAHPHARWRNLLQIGTSIYRVSELRDTELRNTELRNAEIVLAAHRDLLSQRHDAMSKSLLKEGMLDITAACYILTRANRLAAMRESDERITSVFTPFLRGPLRFTYALVYYTSQQYGVKYRHIHS